MRRTRGDRAAQAVPVPTVVEVNILRLKVVMTVMPGRHGQELVDEGFAGQVLRAAGRTLRHLNDEVPGMVHGDYGPQNLLIATGLWEVSAVLDWEFAHNGDPVEDLAWAEWIVRMHRCGAAAAASALFEGYGWRPTWQARHARHARQVPHARGSLPAPGPRRRSAHVEVAN